ncbi:glycerate kinase type-2 family protein [[Eubacterium] cellulosolvens]
MPIKNKDILVSHGNVEGRKKIIDIIDHALSSIDSYKIVKKIIDLKDTRLKINSSLYDLDKIEKLYVIGAGKGVLRIAEALEDILGERIDKGVIIEKRDQGRTLKIIDVFEADHPVPDEDGIKATEEIIKIADSAGEADLVLVCITGGCSALMTKPSEPITLEDTRKVTESLLMSGADIQEINAVRKHLSDVMGGKLALRIHPANIVNLLVIDEVLGLPWGPTVPDTTTFEDAIKALEKYSLWDKIPVSTRNHLYRMNPAQETPKENDFKRLNIKAQNVIIANNETICQAAKQRAEALALNPVILTTTLEGESQDAAIVLSSIANEIGKFNRPFKAPCTLIAGGETTVTIHGQHGEGGRNQELALTASLQIKGSEKIVFASIGTDGTDGPTEIAGGLVDGHTVPQSLKKKIDIPSNLKNHNSSFALKTLEDAIVTGPTGTNVMDLIVIIIE